MLNRKSSGIKVPLKLNFSSNFLKVNPLRAILLHFVLINCFPAISQQLNHLPAFRCKCQSMFLMINPVGSHKTMLYLFEYKHTNLQINKSLWNEEINLTKINYSEMNHSVENNTPAKDFFSLNYSHFCLHIFLSVVHIFLFLFTLQIKIYCFALLLNDQPVCTCHMT